MDSQKKIFPRLMLRILMYFMIIIGIMFLIILISFRFQKTSHESTGKTLDRVMDIQQLIDAIEKIDESLNNYYINPKPEYYRNFTEYRSQAQRLIGNLREQEPKNYRYRDIEAMLDTYLTDCDDTFLKIQNPETRIYAKTDILQLSNLSKYIFAEAHAATAQELTAEQAQSKQAALKIQRASFWTYCISGGLSLLCVIFAYRFSYRISHPILRLVYQFRQVAAGNLKIQEPEKPIEDEMNYLIRSFNQMVRKLDASVEEIKLKSQLEAQLNKELLKNAEINRLLQQAQLQFLQMQINPHFLFNTLNTISALSVVEDAPQTKEMIDNLSSLARYSLSEFDHIVQLGAECHVIQSYLSIQKIRFGDRLTYDIQLPAESLSLEIPAMILQPLVENAIIHGIEPKEAGGHLEIRFVDMEDFFSITISDTGVGIEPDVLSALLLDEAPAHDSRRGIGLSNVRHRLMILYGYDPMTIESFPGRGTSIRLYLSRRISEMTHAAQK